MAFRISFLQIEETCHKLLCFGTVLTLSLPRVINFKFRLQPHLKYYITQCEEHGFSQLTQMKDEYTTNSHYLTHTFLFERLGECTFRIWEWRVNCKYFHGISLSRQMSYRLKSHAHENILASIFWPSFREIFTDRGEPIRLEIFHLWLSPCKRNRLWGRGCHTLPY